MGKGLAMTIRTHLAWLCLAGVLAACGSGSDAPQPDPDRIPDGSEVLAQASLVPGAPAGGLTVADFAAVRQPLALVTVERNDALATVTIEARNGDVIDWRSFDGVGLSLRRGILIATRGLGADVMTIDVTETLEAIAGQRMETTRIHRRLDGQFQTQTDVYVCEVSRAGPESVASLGRQMRLRRITETCTGTAHDFENTYWVGGDGIIWVSRQWVSPEIGLLRVDRIRR